MKTAISVPDPLFEAAEELASRLGLSRSALYAQAVSEFLQRHREDGVTKQLNDLYALQPSNVDPILQQMQVATMASEDW